MALGGGTFVSQNKILPGAYINFVSATRASATLADRGVATMPIVLDWGAMGEVMEVSAADFQRNSLNILGYDISDPKMKGLRDLYKNIRTAYLYRLGSGGTQATNAYATAKYAGERGNALKVVVAVNADDENLFDVTLLLDLSQVDRQTVSDVNELIDNDFVTWSTAALAPTPTAGTPMTGGASPVITNANHQEYIDKIEAYSFNAIGCPSGETVVKGLYSAFTKRMRDDQGVELSQGWDAVEWRSDPNATLVVRISQIDTRLLNLAGILDVQNTRLNGAAQNLTLVPNNIPIRGTVADV